MNASTGRDLAFTALAPMIWGSTYLVTQTLLPPDTPFTAAALRAIPAGLLLLLWTRQRLHGHWWLKASVLGALNIGLFFTCLFAAAYRIPGSLAALLLASQPVWVLLLARWWLGTPLTVTALAQCGLGLLGVVLLLNPGQSELDVVGVVYALVGALSMASGVVLSKRWQRPPTVSQLNLTGWQLLLGGGVLLPLVFWLEGLPTGVAADHLLGYGYLILLGGVLSYGLWFAGIQKLKPFTVSLLGVFSPLTATVLGFVFLQESFGVLQWLGTLSILFGLLLPLCIALLRKGMNRPELALTL
ncbi:EamA family transporter [Saccharospirillum impatiens]|uniref:EamA family transporter n=1 Tax=Saccharospirillum impatiens TaxID=169438 RepID=UPI0004186B87|nr:EamA family transporter [Saccharospirillum impatiens]